MYPGRALDGNGKHRMTDSDMERLLALRLSPFIQLAYRLVDVPRKYHGNMFRHQGQTFFILIDYGYTDHVLLKAAIIHDVLEDTDTAPEEINRLEDGPAVLALVQEVSRQRDESKDAFLGRVAGQGSFHAQVLKCADRIANLADLGFCTEYERIVRTVDETIRHILPMAHRVNVNMARELEDLIASRLAIARKMGASACASACADSGDDTCPEA